MKSLVLLSGGLDSTVLLAAVIRESESVGAVSFDYGQRHRKELAAAGVVADFYGVPHRVVDVPVLASAPSSLTSQRAVPDGHYSDETMAATVVAGRNLLFIANAASLAESLGYDEVCIAAHAGDHPVYPDCRPDFLYLAARAVTLSSEGRVKVIYPFANETKASIVKLGAQLGAPLPLTWSCYKGGDVHCGRCGTCVERCEAFALAGVPDPTEYADAEYWKKVTA